MDFLLGLTGLPVAMVARQLSERRTKDTLTGLQYPLPHLFWMLPSTDLVVEGEGQLRVRERAERQSRDLSFRDHTPSLMGSSLRWSSVKLLVSSLVLPTTGELFCGGAAVKHPASLPLQPEGLRALSARIITRGSPRFKAVTVQRLEAAWSFSLLRRLTCYIATRRRNLRARGGSRG